MKIFSLFFLIFIACLNELPAQSFEFDLIFEDTKGNRDMITIGFEEDATLGIDTTYEEVNIVDKPLGANLDVRLSNWDRVIHSTIPVIYFQSKKQIYSLDGILTFEIYSPNFPLKCYWDKTHFEANDKYRFWMTSINPGGWYDVGGSPSDLGYLIFKEDTSPRSFTSQIKYGLSDDYYINQNGDTISLFWLGYGYMGTPIREIEGANRIVDIFPNPVTDKLNIATEKKIKYIQLFDVSGKRLRSLKQPVSNLFEYSNGLYFLKIQMENGKIYVKKFIKK